MEVVVFFEAIESRGSKSDFINGSKSSNEE